MLTAEGQKWHAARGGGNQGAEAEASVQTSFTCRISHNLEKNERQKKKENSETSLTGCHPAASPANLNLVASECPMLH